MKSLAFLLLTASFTRGAVVFSQVFTVGSQIPDNLETGLLDSRTLSTTGIGSIESIQVTLNLSGGWNGDLYAYVAHDSGFSVLLNRIGRTESESSGSGSSNMNVIFDDAAAAGDIHTAVFSLSQPATGTYQPDGRTDLPSNVTDDATNRTALLSSFNGLAGDGLWELFVVDVSAGDSATFDSWELNLTGAELSAIPEPSSLLALGGLLCGGLWLRNRQAAPQSVRRRML